VKNSTRRERLGVIRQSTPAHPAEACAILLKCYDDGAGAEALLRAFLAERDCNRPRARFWIAVYGLIAEQMNKY
jgi:hypothetical protein